MSYNGSTSEIHCKNVPSRINKKEWYQFVNKHVKNKSWLKHYKASGEWVIVVKSHEKNEWKKALTNKNIQHQRITVYIKEHSSNRGRYKHRQSAFGHGNDKHFRSTKGNNKYSKCFTKHLSKKQQEDMLSLCAKRYNADNKMLNLAQIINTEQEHWASFSNQSFVEHLFSIIKNNCNDVKSVDFSNNNIQTLEPFKKLMEFAPYLENLSLLDNPIKSLSEINYLNGLGANLRELHLRNLNLLNEVCGIKQLYVFELLRIFPTLRLLDGESLQQHCLVSFGSTLNDLTLSFKQQSLSLPVSSHTLSTDQSSIMDFINQYYQLFDDNRRKLMNKYHSDAIFTLTYTSTDTPTPHENRSKDFKIVNDSCTRISRNLIDEKFLCQARYKQMHKVKHGNIDIIKYLSDEFVKRTKHQISYMAIDCHPVKVSDKQFMNVTINGYYAENQSVARKFNRTWLLMQEMNEIRIVNDQLHLGGVILQTKLLEHAPASSIADLNKQTKKQINSPNKVQNGGGINADVSVQMNANEQQDLAQKVANHCGCPLNIAQQALKASNWNAQAAVKEIEILKQRNAQQH